MGNAASYKYAQFLRGRYSNNSGLTAALRSTALERYSIDFVAWVYFSIQEKKFIKFGLYDF